MPLGLSEGQHQVETSVATSMGQPPLASVSMLFLFCLLSTRVGIHLSGLTEFATTLNA